MHVNLCTVWWQGKRGGSVSHKKELRKVYYKHCKNHTLTLCDRFYKTRLYIIDLFCFKVSDTE